MNLLPHVNTVQKNQYVYGFISAYVALNLYQTTPSLSHRQNSIPLRSGFLYNDMLLQVFILFLILPFLLLSFLYVAVHQQEGF